MNTRDKQKLIKEIKRLNEEEKYLEVIDWLPDNILEKYNDYELYAEIAKSKCRLGQEDYDTYAEKSIDLQENAQAYHYLGNSYSDKNLNKAEELYKKALSIDENYCFSYQGLGYVYYKKREIDNSIECYEKSIKINRQNSGAAYNVLGIIFYDMEDFDKAIEYYIESIKIDPKTSAAYYNIANVYFEQEKYIDAKENYQRYLELETKKDFFYNQALDYIREISKIQLSNDYERIQKVILKIQKCLDYEEECITHFTGLSISKELILNNSKFRLSEGTFLNDTSEGITLFDYLDYESPFNKKENQVDEIFVQKPFIGSFVAQSKHNDLTMWRMYGKEGMEEARGCAITMNKEIFVEEVLKTQNIDKSTSLDKNFKFYRVAYKNEKNKFFVPELSSRDPRIKELNDLCDELKKNLEDFNKKPESKDVQKDVEELLFEIAFLFKGIEYQYEHEVRLVQKGIGFEKFIDQGFKIPRVYIKLADISKSINKITLGPKVERADEWASALYYTLQNNDVDAEIHISKQPFK